MLKPYVTELTGDAESTERPRRLVRVRIWAERRDEVKDMS